MMSATIAISLATSKEITHYLTKNWTGALNNSGRKNHGEKTHKKDTTVEGKTTLE